MGRLKSASDRSEAAESERSGRVATHRDGLAVLNSRPTHEPEWVSPHRSRPVSARALPYRWLAPGGRSQNLSTNPQTLRLAYRGEIRRRDYHVF